MKLELVKELQGHEDGILCIAVNGDILFTSSEDNSIKSWQLPDFQTLKKVEAHKSDIPKILLSPDKKFLVSASVDKTVKIWDPASLSLVSELDGHDGKINSAAFMDSENFLTAADDQTLKLWNLNKNRPLKTLDPKIGDVKALDISQDKIAAGGSKLLFLDRNMGVIQENENYIYGINFLRFSEDFKFLFVSTSMEKTLEIWDQAGMTLVKKIKNSTWTNHITFYEDKTILAMAEYIKVLNKDFDTELELEAHSDEMYCLAVYKNFLISAGNDKMLKFWKIVN